MESVTSRRSSSLLYAVTPFARSGLTSYQGCSYLYEGLTQRRIAKSSLMVRAATRLREAGVHVTILDLTADRP